MEREHEENMERCSTFVDLFRIVTKSIRGILEKIVKIVIEILNRFSVRSW